MRVPAGGRQELPAAILPQSPAKTKRLLCFGGDSKVGPTSDYTVLPPCPPT